jgi:hypothetical protein
MLKLLKRLDFNTVKVNFFVFGKESYSTAWGGVISLLNMIILGLVLASFGRDFFLRKNPQLYQKTVYPTPSNNYTIGKRNFTFVIRLEDSVGKQILNMDHLIYFKTEYYKKEIVNGSWAFTEIRTLNVSTCERDNFIDKEAFDDLNLGNALCPDLDGLELGGESSGGTFRKFVRTVFLKCEEGKKNLKNKPCGTKAEFDNFAQNRIFLSFFYPKYYIDGDNYDQPMSTILYNQAEYIDPEMFKSRNLYFKKGELKTDYGWMLASEVTTSSISMDDTQYYFITRSQLSSSQRDQLFSLLIYMSKQEEYFRRTYVKIQNLAADAGGIFKIFYLVNGIFSIWITQNKLFHKMILKNATSFPEKEVKINASLVQSHKIVPIQTHDKNIDKSLNNFLELSNMTHTTGNLKIEHEKVKFGRISFYQYLIFKYFRNSKNNALFKLDKRLKNKLEFINYIHLNNQFESMKEIVLNKFERLALDHYIYDNYFKSSNFNSPSERKELTNLLIEKIKSNEFTERESLIYDKLTDEFKINYK